MIQKGQLTVIDFETYTCIDVVDGYAHLKNVLHVQDNANVQRNTEGHVF